MKVDTALLERLVRTRMAAARLEELLVRLSKAATIGLFPPAGDAATALVAAGLALEGADMAFGTQRDLPLAIARGVSFDVCLAQAMGVEGDPALGRGLPGAVNDKAHGVALTDGSPASHLVHAAGFGHAARLGRADRVAFAAFGSAAQANGEVHAALNFAAVSNAHVVFLARGQRAGEVPWVEAAEAWGVRAVEVAGDDGQAVWAAVREARRRAVAGEGPTIVDARLTAPAEPLDAQALQAAGGWDEQAAASELEARLQEAYQRASQAALVPADSMFDAVFAGPGPRTWHHQG